MKLPPEIDFEQDVMSCPACGSTITARCIADFELGAPMLDPGGRDVSLKVAATLKRFHLNHTCPGRIDAAAPSDDAD